MMEIGPQIPKHSDNVDDDDGEGTYGPPPPPPDAKSSNRVMGSQPVAQRGSSNVPPLHLSPADDADEEEDEDAYAPALPPDLLERSARPATTSKRVLGPALPGDVPYPNNDSDDEIGPMPAPEGAASEEDAVQEFMAREERRAAAADEAASGKKKLVREEWMLVPPSSSGLLGSLDPTKLKARTFSRSARPDAAKQDNSLWTETPAERQARIKDEVHGKRRRATDVDGADADTREEDRKRRRHDEAVAAQVAQYNRENRPEALVEMHKTSKAAAKDVDKDAPIWDHARDMSVGGRLMDETQRSKMISDAKSLGDRFGKSKSSGWL